MKTINLIYSFIFPWLTLAQDLRLNVSGDSFDNYFHRSYFLNGEVFLNSIFSIGSIRPMGNWNLEEIGFSWLFTENTYPLGILSTNGNESTALVIKKIENNYKIFSISISRITKQVTYIDSLNISGPLDGYYHTKAFKHQKTNYMCINFIKGGLPVIKILLLKIDDSGNIANPIEIDRGPLTEPAPLLFHHRWIHQVVPISENRFIITGANQLVSIVDTNLNIVFRNSLKLFDPIINGNVTANRPELFVHDSTTIYAVDAVPYNIPNFFELLTYSIKYKADSIYMDSFSINSNPDNIMKLDPSLTPGENGYYYTVVNEGEELGTFKVSSPSYFNVSKFNGINEIWRKRYGGDYYFRALDIIYFDSCKLLISGSIFDYFKNGLHQGFYTVLDCNGNILLSNLEIDEKLYFIYPNPSSGIFNTNFSDNFQNYEILICVYDINGRELKRLKKLTTPEMMIDLNDLNNGLYILKFIDRGKTYSNWIQLIK